MTTGLKGYLTTAAAAALWGLGGVVARHLLLGGSVDPVTLAQVRMTLTFAFVGTVAAVFRPELLRVRRTDLPLIVLYGTGGLALAQAAYYWTIHETNVSTAVFLQYLAPLFTAAYEILVQGRKPRPAAYGVLAIAVAGALLLLLGRTGGNAASSWVGAMAGLLSALGMACHTVTGRYCTLRANPWTVLLWGSAAGSFVWTLIRPPWVILSGPWTGNDWLLLLFLAVVAGALPFGLYLTGLRRVGPTSAALTATLEPVCASLWAFLLLGEKSGGTQLMGCLLILAAATLPHVLPGGVFAGTRSYGEGLGHYGR